jgi:hypothetical protein
MNRSSLDLALFCLVLALLFLAGTLWSMHR